MVFFPGLVPCSYSMKLLIKVALPLGALSILCWWLIVSAIPEVIVKPVVIGTVRDGVPGNVLVLAERTHDLRSSVSGIVTNAIMLPNGKPIAVEENSTLLTLDATEDERSLKQLYVAREHQEKRIEAGSAIAMQLETEKREMTAWNALAEQGKLPLSDLENQKSLVKRLETQLTQEKITNDEQSKTFRIQEARLLANLKKTKIRSPIPGLMTLSFVAPGDMISPSAHLGQVVSNDRLIVVTLNEEDFAGVREGQEVAVTLLSQGAQIFEGNVTRLSPTVDSASGRRKLYVELESGNERFTPGSSGRAEIIKSVRKNALVVPRKALMGSAVFVVINGVAEAREVKVGARNLLTAEILDGLEAGEQVIVETPHLFRDGQKVKPVPVGGK
jgi:RND family efflux transporter MFP subunit